ncbi:uncharacterized protein KY384_009154 [Bacidia gigantensis]|uniref:uncharacterized protein n=1 Tax=Bacidia gigantensis TaxID=2732470 RepID=UPI001D054EC5|nr:uncharacterized protein KY384_009154 [Bacidia gigantensis]KAG8525510.1 hypothetical protein KY384_009154 [Bacidia gigantensis]
MPTSVGIITTNFPEGKRRNIAFASFGGGNPVGYALGLLLGGIFVKTVGWRYAYYFSLALNAVVFVSAFFSLPADTADRASLDRLKSAVDWVGLALISAVLAILSYVLASITSESSLSPKKPLNIALLILAILLIPTFVAWVGRQETRGRPAIIPNSLWRQSGFTSVCVATFLTWAMFNALAFFATLLMQEIQHISPLQTSLQFLPLVVLSVFANFVAGYLVDKVAANKLAFGATVLSAGAPLIFALLSPEWPFWAAMFPAMCLIPLSSDFLFNIANLVITATFSTKDQALAGGVFNTVSQLGSSIGLAVTAAIAASVESSGSHGDMNSAEAALKGYRTVFWTCLGAALASCAISTFGLRKSGKVGLKRE